MRRVGLPPGGSTLTTSAPEPREREPAVLRLLVGQLDDADAGERAGTLRRSAGHGTLVLCCHGMFLWSWSRGRFSGAPGVGR